MEECVSFPPLLLDFLSVIGTNQGARITRNIMFQAKNIDTNLKYVSRKKMYGNLKSLAKSNRCRERLQTLMAIIIQLSPLHVLGRLQNIGKNYGGDENQDMIYAYAYKHIPFDCSFFITIYILSFLIFLRYLAIFFTSRPHRKKF